MHAPYIGITGFTNRKDAEEVLSILQKESERKLMVGVLMSQKTFEGGTNKWPNRYPRVEQCAHIFPEHPLALNLIHYNTKDRSTLFDQMVQVTHIAGPNFHGFQLNVAWPEVRALERYRLRYPDKKIVLQIGGLAFEVVGHSPAELVRSLQRYARCIDYVLLDPSGGWGKPFDTAKVHEYLQALIFALVPFRLGVAGGLSPTTLHLIEPLAREFPDLCIDAEGRLRDANDCLDLPLAKDYVLRALAIFCGRDVP